MWQFARIDAGSREGNDTPEGRAATRRLEIKFVRSKRADVGDDEQRSPGASPPRGTWEPHGVDGLRVPRSAVVALGRGSLRMHMDRARRYGLCGRDPGLLGNVRALR